MKLSKCNFRDLYKQCILIKGISTFEKTKYVLEKHSFTPPAKADSILCYCYIDADAGMSFDFICPAFFEIGEPDFESYEKLHEVNIRLFYRYGAVQDDDIKIFSQDVSVFDKQCKRIDEWYHRDEKVLLTRNIKEIDHLRFLESPDDIMIELRKDGLLTEMVWARLSGIESGNLAGVLLNEPHSDFGIHIGDIVHVQITIRGNETFALCLLPKQ